jgi:acetyl-CoA acetyltransferase
MRRVARAGVGITPRNRAHMANADRMSWKRYVADAAYDAMADANKGLGPKDIQYIIVNYHGESSLEAGGIGPIVSDVLGMHPVGVTAICANCVGAGVSAHDAYGDRKSVV